MKRFILLPLILLAGIGVAYFYISGDYSGDAPVTPSIFDDNMSRASAGDIKAQYALAEAYRLGNGVEVNSRQAYRWYEKAAKKGHTRALLQLGRMLENGDGVRQDLVQAIKWYRLAASLGQLAEAEFAIGELYFHGRGQAQDYSEALGWYKKAAAKGHPIAQHLMGGMYEEGWAVGRDLIEAYKWYTLAIPARVKILEFNPLYDSQKSRDMLIRKMNKFQIGRGQERAQAWKKSGS